MRKIIISLFVLLCAATVNYSCTHATRTADGQPIPEWIMGVYRTYPTNIVTDNATPDGYEPFYISHYGRHGSRYMLDDSQYDLVSEVLGRAATEDKLTESGRKVYEEFANIYPQLKGKNGALTEIGAVQHRQIAQRMVDTYPTIFDNDAKVKASTTPTPRTEQSMKAFCLQLKHCFPALQIAYATDSILNPYSASSGIPTPYDLTVKSRKAEWRGDFELFCRQKIDARDFAKRIFSDADYATTLCDPTKFEIALFDIARHFDGCGIDIDWLHLFTLDEMSTLARCSAYTFYMEKGPARQTSDREWALSAYILDKIVKDADQDMVDGTSVDLRFGHDGCIMALLTLMGVKGWDSEVNTGEEISRAWDVSQIPMACNLQFVFYRQTDPDKDILVRVLLNESPLQIPISGTSYFYKWQDLKQYFESQCNTAFAILSTANVTNKFID